MVYQDKITESTPDDDAVTVPAEKPEPLKSNHSSVGIDWEDDYYGRMKDAENDGFAEYCERLALEEEKGQTQPKYQAPQPQPQITPNPLAALLFLDWLIDGDIDLFGDHNE